jgi:tripartite-type tricarboxylate transporter receptor subunit TctC
MSSWIGLVAPAGTPRAIVDKLAREVAAIHADRDVAARLEKAGITAVTSTPDEFDAFFRAEAERWTKAYKETGIRLE